MSYEELHNITSSPNTIIRWTERLILVRKMKNAYIILVGRPQGKILLRKNRCGWEDNIKIDLKYDMRV
jgi:hypothetical protein